MQRQAEILAAFLDLPCHAEIGLRWGRIARGVVVDQDQGAGVQDQCPLDHFTRVDRDVVHRADRHLLIRDDAVLAIEIEDMEPLDRAAHGQRAIVTHRLPAADDRVLAEVTTEDVAGGEDDCFFLWGHGYLAEMNAPRPLPCLGRGQRRIKGERGATTACAGGRSKGVASADPIEKLLGVAFQGEPGILLGFLTRQTRDPLHKIEDALGRMALFHQHLLDDLARLRF